MTGNHGHSPGTAHPESLAVQGSAARPPVHTTVVPRLLSVEEAGIYIGLSAWSIRDYIAAGILTAVALPAPRDRDRAMRRVLIDRYDLDALIERQKSRGDAA